MRRGLVVSGALVCVMATTVRAMWMNSPEPVPVERLIANLTRHVERDPKNAKAHYVLGRVRSFAYAQAAETVKVTKRASGEESPDRDDDAARDVPDIWHHEPIVLERKGDVDAKRIEHFKEAVLHLRLAAELDPKKAVHHLGLAWLLDSGSDLALQLGWPDGVERKSDLTEQERALAEKDVAALVEHGEAPESFRRLRKLGPRAMPLVVPARSAAAKVARPAIDSLLTAYWGDLAFESYRAAFRLALPDERKAEHFDMEGPPPVTKEAGDAILRLLDSRALSEADAGALRKEVEDGVREIERKGMFITPVVFPVSGDTPLSDLVPTGRTALFDLDGDDVLERWPWPTADAAILVWRPDPSVPVTSGRQLFGSRTWWIFWDDGYEPLAALDDDGDGRLAGAELDGICVWRDRNGDAREDAGEVVTAEAFGVAAIETRPDTTEDGVPAHRRGIVLTDGSTRPTYDWTPHAVPGTSGP